MRRITLQDRLGVGRVTLSSPKVNVSIEDNDFTIRFRRYGDVEHLPRTELVLLRDWCDAAIKERPND